MFLLEKKGFHALALESMAKKHSKMKMGEKLEQDSY